MKIEDMLNKIFLETPGNFEYLKKIPDNSIDLILTDPPYLTTKKEWDKKEVFNEEVIKEFYRVAKDSCSIYVWCGLMTKKKLLPSLIRWYSLLYKYFEYKDVITWKKTRGNGMTKGWLKIREEILWFVKDNKKFIWNKEEQYSKEERKSVGVCSFRTKTGKIYTIKSPFYRFSNIWTDISEEYWGGRNKPGHFTPKPLKAIERIIKLHTKEGDVVLDPFIGSGTTAVACKRLNRNFIGMEIYQKYIDISYKRLLEVKQGEGLK